MQIWAESGKSALPICNYSQILYQFLTFTQNLKRSLHLSDEEDGTQKMTVLLNTQNGQETVTLNDLTQCSSNVHMVHHRGLEPRTH